MRTKKHLGQNFLKNTTILKNICEAANIKKEDIVLEIGPGNGELTKNLYDKKPKKLILIEKDTELIPYLKEKFTGAVIIEGDALKKISRVCPMDDWKLIGNIPYYITGKLLRIISELPNPPCQTILLVQKEVAERIISAPPKANLLSSAVCGWATPKYLFSVSRRNFCPAPKVDSAAISLYKHKNICSQKYFLVARALFKQPRKKAINNLKNGFNLSKTEAEKIFSSCGLPIDIRPQNISPENIICLSSQNWRF